MGNELMLRYTLKYVEKAFEAEWWVEAEVVQKRMLEKAYCNESSFKVKGQKRVSEKSLVLEIT